MGPILSFDGLLLRRDAPGRPRTAKILNALLPKLQIKEGTLVHLQGVQDREEVILLHGMRLYRLHLHSPSQEPETSAVPAFPHSE